MDGWTGVFYRFLTLREILLLYLSNQQYCSANSEVIPGCFGVTPSEAARKRWSLAPGPVRQEFGLERLTLQEVTGEMHAAWPLRACRDCPESR